MVWDQRCLGWIVNVGVAGSGLEPKVSVTVKFLNFPYFFEKVLHIVEQWFVVLAFVGLSRWSRARGPPPAISIT